MTSIFPPGSKAGTTIEVTTAGADQDEAALLLFSHPGITGKPKSPPGQPANTAQTNSNTFEVSIAADVPTGVYEARLVGRFGASNPRAFVVGRGDEIAEPGGNSSPAAAAEIRLGLTANGRADANAVDYYKLKLAAGQRVLVECAAERIDSRMDGTLAVLDAAGRELARNRDTDGRDPLIDFTASSEAEYLVAVHDFLYRGGAEYFYRLTAHAEPRVDFVFPPCGPAGSNQPYTVYGRNLPGGKPAAGVAVAGTPLESITVSIPLPADAANPPNLESASLVPPQSALIDAVDYRLGNSNPVRIGIAQAPVVVEQEPANNDAATAQLVSVPCEYVGQFYPAGDVDWIEFAATKGQVLGIDVLAHRLGLDSDPCLTLVKLNPAADGQIALQEIAAVDDLPERQALIGSDFDISTDDPSYRFVVPEDAKYRLMVRDQFGDARHDARFVYRLRIAPEQPDFRLAAVPQPPRVGQNPNQVPLDSLVLRRGEASLIKVIASRRDGFPGEIDITAEGLPTGVTCSGAVIGGDVNTAWLVFSAAENAPAAAAAIRIVGKANREGQTIAVAARPGAAVWGTADRQQAAPVFRVTRDLVLSVMDQETAPATIQVGDGNLVEASRGGSLELPVRVTRRGGFDGELKLVAEGLPNEIQPADITLGGGAQDGKLVLALTNANAKPGTYTFYLQGEAKLKLPRNPNDEKGKQPRDVTWPIVSTPIKIRLLASP
ncbi:MAG: hypothetical protein MUE50_08260 [Pirellulaceae bacterium]|nr:hypothetical protein [Pirellulaceae bacterium]